MLNQAHDEFRRHVVGVRIMKYMHIIYQIGQVIYICKH